MLHGWIMLHRKILDNWVSQDPEMLAVWVRILLEANHSDTKKMFNGCHIEVKRGQLIFGLNAFSLKSGVSENKVRRYISLLEKDGMINRLKTNKYSLISIVSFDSYQGEHSQNAVEQQSNDTQITIKPQHRNNVNNVDNGKNVKNKEIYVEGLNKEAWHEWVAYKKKIKSPYKTEISEKTKANELVRISNGNHQQQLAIVRQSIENDWKGLFALKNQSDIPEKQIERKRPRAFGQ